MTQKTFVLTRWALMLTSVALSLVLVLILQLNF
jgi:hypothetical protein